jgi:hypothetical protein
MTILSLKKAASNPKGFPKERGVIHDEKRYMSVIKLSEIK